MNWRQQNIRLRRLEAEAIYIMREVVSEFRNPVMLYSIGKDSSVMLHIAQKAFPPSKPPFPLLHVDTTWKFREMIAFRDETAARLGMDLLVHVNEEGLRARHFAGRFRLGRPHAGDEDRRPAPGARQVDSSTPRSAARGATRKKAAPKSASSRIARRATAGIRATSARSCGACSTRASSRAKSMRVFPLSNWTELDVWEYITAENIPVVPLYFAKPRPVVERDGALIMVDDDRLPLLPGETPRMMQVRFRTLGCYPLTGAVALERRHARRDHRRNARVDAVRSGRAASSITMKPARWKRKSARAISDERARDMSPMLRATAYWTRSALRFLTCGSVDDGKSTLIGRLLYEQNLIFDDHLAALERDFETARHHGAEVDFALLLDGLEAEREQGITIDVAYRYFATPRRAFIVADTPGHEQYTRNMATGASNADLAVLLVDARKGLLSQTRRHAIIASLLGIRYVVLAVNKIDLVDFDRGRFDRSPRAFATLPRDLGFKEIKAIPISARYGDNVSSHSERMPWYAGPQLLDYLETVGCRGRPRRQAVPHAGAMGQSSQCRFPRLCRHDRERQR